MATIDAGFAAWLKSTALYTTSAPSGVAETFGSKAVSSEIVSAIAFAPDAVEEAARQAAFLGYPLARDEHVVVGRLASLVGRVVPIRGDRLGYDAAPLCFVLEASEQDDGTTRLTVLKRL